MPGTLCRRAGAGRNGTDADAADGSVDKGVTIEDFYTGGANVVEQVISADNMVFDVTALL